jgi:hypothetical protein
MRDGGPAGGPPQIGDGQGAPRRGTGPQDGGRRGPPAGPGQGQPPREQ